MFTAVRTGSFTAGFAIIALVMYRSVPVPPFPLFPLFTSHPSDPSPPLTSLDLASFRPNDNISVFFSLSLGRLYTLSMLSNLNARHSNDDTSRGPSSGGDGMGGMTSSAARVDGGRSRGQSRTKGIKITSETVTRVDGEEIERAEGKVSTLLS